MAGVEDEDTGAFARLWHAIVDQTITEAAFVEMVIDARRSQSDYDGGIRLRRMVEPLLVRAQQAAQAPADLTMDDLVLVQRMVYGVVVTAHDDAEARRAAERVLQLIGPTDGDDGAS
ncbi:hypothetical protein SAMN05216410_3067 [Sanguibacter gelidistatuariae]|uniref:Transcriptional repressor C-terminal n=1 Tax=Sanguibacter gelidistatuariae TaxID=1814289 RepID=A0A1G6TAI5_9MICO|nr:hypothetical protein [Sanguibacter gelidistatuariae]SDD26029.1 hypothetical protein SAMN05216410_3067 [Sanguibacter gelidistatuariae]